MKKQWFIPLFMFILAFSTISFSNQREGRLLRFPDIANNQIVFVYAGNLWLVDSNGGTARQITSQQGLELFPKFSPDGSKIAFTGQYDGNMNVYVIPAEGGVPRQLTFTADIAHMPLRMGPNNQVIDWFPDGKHILFLSRQNTFNDWFGQLYKISVNGGLQNRIVLPKGGLAAFSPDGNRLAYNRIFRNFRTWKRYKGGMAQDIWLYNFKTNKLDRLTKYPGTDTYPMWYKNKIYFGSDRGPNQRINIYSYDLTDGKISQLTHFKNYDVYWPSIGGDKIVFQNAGYLYVLDLNNEKVRKLTIYIPG
ncbi:MAG TPA: protease, partial [Bacteroidetes bacterium]|nr:protease [Bacteroidota bacterium]